MMIHMAGAFNWLPPTIWLVQKMWEKVHPRRGANIVSTVYAHHQYNTLEHNVWPLGQVHNFIMRIVHRIKSFRFKLLHLYCLSWSTRYMEYPVRRVYRIKQLCESTNAFLSSGFVHATCVPFGGWDAHGGLNADRQPLSNPFPIVSLAWDWGGWGWDLS